MRGRGCWSHCRGPDHVPPQPTSQQTDQATGVEGEGVNIYIIQNTCKISEVIFDGQYYTTLQNVHIHSVDGLLGKARLLNYT